MITCAWWEYLEENLVCWEGNGKGDWKDLLNRDFNLTRILVPIKCIQAATALHYIWSLLFCSYFSYAGSISYPLERLKLVMTSNICSFYYLSTFEKTMYPDLGELFIADLRMVVKWCRTEFISSSYNPFFLRRFISYLGNYNI